MFPYEVLELVFSYLPPKDLDVVPLVCRAWNEVASDKVWRKQFADQFGTTNMSPVSAPFRKWRKEALCRRVILQKWRRGVKSTDKTIYTTLRDATEVFVSFTGQESSAYCINSSQGYGVVIDLERGKVLRRFYASKISHETTPLTMADGSRFGVIYGSYDGQVQGKTFSRDGSYNPEDVDLPYRHPTAVSALWVAKTRSFAKPAPGLISIVSGSLAGTIYVSNGIAYKEFHPQRGRVLMVEGCMYGAYIANDGSSVVAVYDDGSLYQITNTGLEGDGMFAIEKLDTLPLTEDLIDETLRLEQCNECIIFCTRRYIYVRDLTTQQVTYLDMPDGDLTSFCFDTTFTPGHKCIVAGFFTNILCMWTIPPVPGAEEVAPENKIVLVNPITKPKSVEPIKPENKPGQFLDDQNYVEERHINSAPVWRIDNPIGYDHRLGAAVKPQITEITANSAVLLVGGYNGRVYAVDILSGKTLKRIDSRISKNVLDFSQYSRDGLVPVTSLQIDPDPNRLRGIIGVRSAVQFFDLGSTDKPRKRTTSRTKRNSTRRRHRDINLDSSNLMHDLNEELALNEEFAVIDAENDERRSNLREDFALSDLEDDEQVAYALMLSNQQSQQSPAELNHIGEPGADDMDEELRIALELSRLEDERANEEQEYSRLQENWDEDEYSELYENLNGSGSHAISDANISPDYDAMDEEEALRIALARSLDSVP